MAVYTIRQAAQIVKVSENVLRYWDTHVPLLAVSKNEYGCRFFSNADLAMYIRFNELIHKRKYSNTQAVRTLAHQSSALSRMNNIIMATFICLLAEVYMMNKNISHIRNMQGSVQHTENT